MVPVGEGKDNLLVEVVVEGALRIVYDEGCSKSIRILASGVGVEPIGPWLVDLD